MHELIFAYWFFLPAGLANGAPVVANVIPGLKHLNQPLDGGRMWRGKPIFGAHKTWRGLLAGMATATAVLAIEQFLARHHAWAVYASGPVDYTTLTLWVLGPLFGFGALMGDAIESFFKRRVAREAGTSWVPFDQIDYVLGGLIASLAAVRLRPYDYLAVLALWFVLHFAGSYLGYMLKLKDRPL